MEKEYRKNGIPLLQPVVDDLRALGEQFSIKLDSQ
jgi:hypothetical protein